MLVVLLLVTDQRTYIANCSKTELPEMASMDAKVRRSEN
jgi:hypothetical protein